MGLLRQLESLRLVQPRLLVPRLEFRLLLELQLLGLSSILGLLNNWSFNWCSFNWCCFNWCSFDWASTGASTTGASLQLEFRLLLSTTGASTTTAASTTGAASIGASRLELLLQLLERLQHWSCLDNCSFNCELELQLVQLQRVLPQQESLWEPQHGAASTTGAAVSAGAASA